VKILQAAAMAAFAFVSFAVQAETMPPKTGEFVIRDFRFHTGETMQELKIHYTTLGDPSGIPVLVLHGTTGSAASMLTPAFAGELYGEGQPLDTAKYFIVIPDGIGHGKSSKPSDGMKASFPKYDYDDMVEAQYRLLTEHLGIRHVRLVIGNSMGGMQTWIWGEKYPNYMDALVPMASQPSPMAARNWMTRRILIETVKNDPAYNGGNYAAQPATMKYAKIFFDLTTAGGTLAYQTLGDTHAKSDKMMDDRLAMAPPADANDFIYQWESSADYDPSPGLEQIQATLLAINAADDERNPPETGILERDMKRVKNGKLFIIPASTETRGHLTTGSAKFYKQQLQELLQTAPQRSM
jgi:homoserine O-acetyltransferase/O-succinyltransferase